MMLRHWPARMGVVALLSFSAFQVCAAAPQFTAVPIPDTGEGLTQQDAISFGDAYAHTHARRNAAGDTVGTLRQRSEFESSFWYRFDAANPNQTAHKFLSATPFAPSTGLQGIEVRYLDQSSQAYVMRGGTMQTLGTFGLASSEASFINDKGQVVGNAYDRVVHVNYDTDGRQVAPGTSGHYIQTERQRAFLYDDEGMHDLGTPDVADSSVQALNNRGEVLVQNGSRALLYHDGQRTEFGGSADVSSARLLNEQGTVAGWFNRDAFVYQNGALSKLGLSEPGDDTYISIDFLTETNYVAGTISDSANGRRGFLYKDGEIEIIALPDGHRDVDRLRGVDDQGNVLLSSFTDDYRESRSFLYRHGEVIDLTDAQILVDGLALPNASIQGLGKDGRLIASNGLGNFVLTQTSAVPEPKTAMLMLMGLGLLAGLARRRL